MRSDPSDTGGMFVGRRPGTAPIHFRESTARGGEVRRRLDTNIARALWALIFLLSLCCWGPIPLACLWVGSQVSYLAGNNVGLGILVSFAALFALMFGTLTILRRLDHAWILVRRAAGFDQKAGVLGRVFALTAAVGVAIFTVWFVVIHGPGSSVMPGGSL
ncbi:MAG: hypothetical protein FWD42_08250 [Solirubrobacterales bacterium]|nr:hypothetical protein [Solirubrobacterales bacterium]